jgi:hypothetical protein
MSIEREIAHDLLSIGAVFLRPDEPFTWASGIKSPIYCDNRLTLTAPAVRAAVENGLVDLICKYYPDVEVLMGTSTAGIAHAAICGYIMGLPMGYVRSGHKDHGRGNQIEGRLEPGDEGGGGGGPDLHRRQLHRGGGGALRGRRAGAGHRVHLHLRPAERTWTVWRRRAWKTTASPASTPYATRPPRRASIRPEDISAAQKIPRRPIRRTRAGCTA